MCWQAWGLHTPTHHRFFSVCHMVSLTAVRAPAMGDWLQVCVYDVS
jgi:hypothetical protein